MDKLYSKNALIAKTVFSVGISQLYMLIAAIVSSENVFTYIVFSVAPIGCLYTVPFWITVSYLKKYRVSKIGKYIAWDAATCLAPAFLGVLASEIIYVLVNNASNVAGMITIIFSVLFIIISVLFWVLYLALSKI